MNRSNRIRFPAVPQLLIAVALAAATFAINLRSTKADEVLTTVYGFGGSGTLDIVDPSSLQDTGTLISGFSGPSSVAIGAGGNIYVGEEGTEPGDIQQYSLTYTSNTLSGSTTGLTATYANTLPLLSDEEQGVAILSTGAVRIGPDGNVYATDFGSGFRTSEMLPDTALFEFSGTSGSFISAAVPNMTAAAGLVFDNAGNIYISDFGTQFGYNGKVVKYNPTTSTVSTIIVSGTGPSNNPLDNPEGLVLLPNGNLLVGDAAGNGTNGNILEYTTSGTSVANSPWAAVGSNYTATYPDNAFFPGSMTLTPNGQDVLVANLGPNFVTGSVVEFDLHGNIVMNVPTAIVSDVAVLQSPAVTWNSALSGGMYSNGDSNWTGVVSATSAPNAAGANATFGPGDLGATATVTINGQFTVGTLAFNNSTTQYILQSADDTSSITMNNNGLGAMVTVPSGGQTHTINTPLILADIGSTAFNVGSGSTLNIGSPITGSGALAVTGGGNVVITSGGSIAGGGGTTVENGQLQISSGGSISGPLTLMVAYGYNGELDLAANSTFLDSITSSTDSVAGTTASVNVAGGSSLSTSGLSISGTLNMNSGMTNTGSIAVNAGPTFADNSQLNVNNGLVQITSETSNWSVGANATITVASVATLQLTTRQVIFATAGAGSSSSAADTTNLVTIDNHGSTASGGGLYVLNSTQTVGQITGTSTDSSGATVYDGDTVVGDGSNSANLTASQILQNSLTINAGSTVTISPATSNAMSDGAPATAAAGASASQSTAAASTAAANGNLPAVDPLAAIQAAIDSGAISDALGERLENSITAVERLAAVDPSYNPAYVENAVLAELPSFSATDESDGGQVGTSLDFVSSDSLGGSGSFEIGSATAIGGANAVPEPASILLAGVAAIGLLFASRRVSHAACGVRQAG